VTSSSSRCVAVAETLNAFETLQSDLVALSCVQLLQLDSRRPWGPTQHWLYCQVLLPETEAFCRQCVGKVFQEHACEFHNKLMFQSWVFLKHTSYS
jgi:hypothetical protein